MSKYRVVLVTCPPEAEEKLARALVEERLAACVNAVPNVTSTYRWEGRVERAGETLLVIKTEAARLDALTERVRALHPYEVPEVIALPIEAGSLDYLRWLSGAVAPE